MLQTQHAGENLVNVELKGDHNNVTIINDARALSDNLAEQFEALAPDRIFKILVCLPTADRESDQWAAFAHDLTEALANKGFEIILGGRHVPRTENEYIFVAEEEQLSDRQCHALLVIACDYVTLSQLTHLTSVIKSRRRRRQHIVVVPNQAILEGEAYFKEGALLAAEQLGHVFLSSPSNELIAAIVNQFMLYKNLK